MNNKTAVIIAGGLNTRINMIKPLINLGGKQLLIRIHDVLKEIFSEIILVIRQDQDGEIPDLGLALKMYVIEDEFPNKGPLGMWASQAEGYFVFPKLEGPISNRMTFKGKEVITWSINDYLGLSNLYIALIVKNIR